jgi:hypothetical protein
LNSFATLSFYFRKKYFWITIFTNVTLICIAISKTSIFKKSINWFRNDDFFTDNILIFTEYGVQILKLTDFSLSLMVSDPKAKACDVYNLRIQ